MSEGSQRCLELWKQGVLKRSLLFQQGSLGFRIFWGGYIFLWHLDTGNHSFRMELTLETKNREAICTKNFLLPSFALVCEFVDRFKEYIGQKDFPDKESFLNFVNSSGLKNYQMM